MARNVVTIPVWNDSDGQHAPSKDRNRNDGYFEERLGELWMKERGQAQPGVVYRLDRLPTGYSGWEKRRGESKHVDRCKLGLCRCRESVDLIAQISLAIRVARTFDR